MEITQLDFPLQSLLGNKNQAEKFYKNLNHPETMVQGSEETTNRRTG